MYNGKYNVRKRRLRWKREFVLSLSAAILILGVVGGSLAYLFTSTDNVVNTFTPAEVPPTVTESFDGDVKENVSVINKGNTDAYIRAAVVINWVDSEEHIVSDPEGHEYYCTFNLNNGWFEGGDGFYYYSMPVAAGDFTTDLISEAAPTEGSEYQLKIEIMAQTIQAVPATAVTAKWGVTVADDGTISKQGGNER